MALALALTDTSVGRADPKTHRSGEWAVVHGPGGKLVGASDKRVPRPQLFRVGLRSGEPTIGVTEDGQLFFEAWQDSLRMEGSQSGVEVLRSRDKGRTWEIVSPRLSSGHNTHRITLDPYLYVDEETSRVFTVDLYGACSVLSYSDDRGESWTTNPLACGRPVNDHQTLFSGPPMVSPTLGYPRIVYYCWNDIVSSSCSKSLDGGITFSPTGTPAFPGVDSQTGEHCGGLHGAGVVGADGTVYLPREYCERPFLAISRDEGATWTRVQVADNGSSRETDPSVDADSQGNLYFGWIAEDRLPYLAISVDGGMTWGSPMMIGAPGVAEANLLTLDVGSPRSVAFAYMGTEDRRFPKSWHGYMSMTVTALERRPIFYSTTVNNKADPLKQGTCGPGRCGDDILDFLDVVIAPDGTPWAAFVDACNESCAETGLAEGNEGIAGHLFGGPNLRGISH